LTKLEELAETLEYTPEECRKSLFVLLYEVIDLVWLPV
jgi:hypothetical protein